jgi:hypothetical protein
MTPITSDRIIPYFHVPNPFGAGEALRHCSKLFEAILPGGKLVAPSKPEVQFTRMYTDSPLYQFGKLQFYHLSTLT